MRRIIMGRSTLVIQNIFIDSISDDVYHLGVPESFLGRCPPHSLLLHSPIFTILQHSEFLWTGISQWINCLVLYDFTVDIIQPSAGLHSPTNSQLAQHIIFLTHYVEVGGWDIRKPGKVVFGEYEVLRSIQFFSQLQIFGERWYFLQFFHFFVIEIESISKVDLLQFFSGGTFIFLRIKYLQNINEIFTMFVKFMLPQPVMVEGASLGALNRIVSLRSHQIPHLFKQPFVRSYVGKFEILIISLSLWAGPQSMN